MNKIQIPIQGTDTLVTRQVRVESMFPESKWEDEVTAYIPCPGQHKHTRPNRPHDCWVKINGAPTAYCVHGSCTEEIDAANKVLRTGLKSSVSVVLTAEQKQLMVAAKVKARQAEELKARTKSSLSSLLKNYTWSYDQIVTDSPISIPRADWEAMLHSFLGMFSEEDVVWIGEVSDTGKSHHAAHFRTKDEWRRGVTRVGPYTCPSCFVPGSISRSKDNVAVQHYLVVESDSLTKDEVGAIFRWLDQAVGLPLRAVVDTAGKSLHGWFEYPPEEVLEELKVMLPVMGCDPKMFGPSQPCRLPGGLRDGRIQKLIYSKTGGCQ